MPTVPSKVDSPERRPAMALHTKVDGDGLEGQRLAVDPLLVGEAEGAPKHRLPDER